MLDFLETERSHRVPLFVLNGFFPGPRLVVVGTDALLRQLAERFWNRPDLSGIRGAVVLRPLGQDVRFDRPDQVLDLSDEDHMAATCALLRVLIAMSALGMVPT